jgi:hypothetical protein
LKLTEPQKEILNNSARFKVVAAGRRFGKTYASIASLAKYARFPNSKCMYIAPTHGMCRQILWPDLKDQMRERKWIKKINESNLEILLVNGSIIMLRSADTPDRVRGIGLNHLVIDEASDVSEEIWTAVRPTLSDKNGSALIIGTPRGYNWFREFYENAKHQADWASWQYTTAEGGNVPESELTQAQQDLGEREYRQEYEAQFVDASGVIYYSFGEWNIVDTPIQLDNRTVIHSSFDFNIDPICAVVGIKTANSLHIFDEFEIWNSHTQELCDEINTKYPNQAKVAFADASGAQRRTSAGGVTDHIIIKNSGFRLLVGSVNPSVKDRIASVNAALKNKTNDVKLTISPKCVKLIEALRKQTYKEGTKIPEKGGARDYSHIVDALGYMVNSLFPVNIERTGKLPPMRRSTGSFN